MLPVQKCCSFGWWFVVEENWDSSVERKCLLCNLDGRHGRETGCSLKSFEEVAWC